MVINPTEVADFLVRYYKSLFTTYVICQPEEAINKIPSLITPEMNAKLSTNFMLWEVQVSLKQMASLKAPSPDSMPPLFYQNYWNLIGTDVSQFVLSFLNYASLP